MSLQLRIKCQPILNEYNLDDYHARVNDSKYLTIVGPCGKPLFTLSGICFARTAPSKDEIDICAPLLEEFLIAHNKIITEYFKLIKAYQAAECTAPAGVTVEAVKGGHPGYRVLGHIVKIKDKLTNETISWDTRNDQLVTYDVSGCDTKDVGKLANDKNRIKQATKYYRELIVFQKTDDALTECLQRINSCDI